MRPKKPTEEKRVPFNCLVLPVTFRAILDSVVADKVSQGVVIDRAIALMCFGDEMRSAAITSEVISRSVERAERQIRPAVEMRTARGIRPKGDKTR